MITLSPEEIEFDESQTPQNKKSFKINNTSTTVIIFRVKTNAPKRYHVRPNQGVIELGTSAKIKVHLNTTSKEPKETDKLDKFQILSAEIPVSVPKPLPGESQNTTNTNLINNTDYFNEVWKSIPPTAIAKAIISVKLITAKKLHGAPL